jgi:hypothetical protein
MQGRVGSIQTAFFYLQEQWGTMTIPKIANIATPWTHPHQSVRFILQSKKAIKRIVSFIQISLLCILSTFDFST